MFRIKQGRAESPMVHIAQGNALGEIEQGCDAL